MKSSDLPTLKFPIVWGANAGPGYIRDIPVDSQIGIQDGAASLSDGYPPLTMTPVGAGGVWPFGQDTNGILKEITSWLQWYQAGAPVSYDSSFSSTIGGYPKGAILQVSGSPGWYWLSTVNDNTSDPDTGGANWQLFTCNQLYGADTGTKNAGHITLQSPPPSQASLLGIPIVVTKMNVANDSSYTLNVGFGNTAVINSSGSAVAPGELPANGVFTVVLDPNGNFQLQGVDGSSRTQLTGLTNFYVSTTGSDSNDGLTLGTAWATVQHAWNTLIAQYDLAGHYAVVNIADGTYTSGLAAHGLPPGATNIASIQFVSSSGNPAACLFSTSATCFLAANGAWFTLSGVGVASSATNGLEASNQGRIDYSNVNFGVCANAHQYAWDSSQITCSSNYSISGGAVNHILSARNGVVYRTGFSCTLSGTPAFSGAFAQASDNGTIYESSGSYSGSATGVRFNASLNGVIDPGTTSLTYYPGNAAGVLAEGGQYPKTQSLAANGYMWVGGLLFQWGTTASFSEDDGTQTISFPVSFPNACFGVNSTNVNASGSSSVNYDMWPQVVSISTASFGLKQQHASGGSTATSLPAFWFAVGN